MYDFSKQNIGFVRTDLNGDGGRLLFPFEAKKPSILQSYNRKNLIDLVAHWNTYKGYCIIYFSFVFV